MPEEIIKTEKKSWRAKKIMVTAVIIIGLAAAFFYFYKLNDVLDKGQVNVGQSEPMREEAENIKALNQPAINAANNAVAQAVRPISATDHFEGNINAPVQIIVYEDFECPFCADFYDTVKKIQENFGTEVAIAFRHFPLTTHPLAATAAIASECAAEQGKFWEMYDKLFMANKENLFTADQFRTSAVEIGLEAVKFNLCLETEKYKDKIQAQMVEGRNFSVTGTPTTFVNGKFLTGAVPYDDFIDSSGRSRPGMKTIIEMELK